MRRSVTILAILALSLPGLVLANEAQMTAYTAAVGDHYGVNAAQAELVAGFLPRLDELPAVFQVAKEADVDPAEVARQRYDGKSWTDIMTGYKLGMALFHVEVRGFIPSPVYQPILDKFETENPAQWNSAPLNDRDVLNMANLKFIMDKYDYSMYRVMAMRDKGQPFTTINEEVYQLTRNQPEKGKTANAGF